MQVLNTNSHLKHKFVSIRICWLSTLAVHNHIYRNMKQCWQACTSLNSKGRINTVSFEMKNTEDEEIRLTGLLQRWAVRMMTTVSSLFSLNKGIKTWHYSSKYILHRVLKSHYQPHTLAQMFKTFKHGTLTQRTKELIFTHWSNRHWSIKLLVIREKEVTRESLSYAAHQPCFRGFSKQPFWHVIPG